MLFIMLFSVVKYYLIDFSLQIKKKYGRAHEVCSRGKKMARNRIS